MKVLSAILFFICLVSCSEYPDGFAREGEYSYSPTRHEDVVAWQNEFRQMAIQAIKLPSQLFSTDLSSDQIHDHISPINFDEPQYANLKKTVVPFESQKVAQKACHKNSKTVFYVQRSEHVRVANCDSIKTFPEQGVDVYDVRLKAYDGFELRAYFLLPIKGDVQPQHSLIYWHGHASSRESASFDYRNYNKAIGLDLALRGVVTIVPTVRYFEIDGSLHTRLMKTKVVKAPDLMTRWVYDAWFWGQWIEHTSFSRLKIADNIEDAPFRKHRHVAGTSLGSQIALWIGALDERYETVSTFGGFYGFEVLYSKFHDACQHVPALIEKANITDLALLVWPRKLQIGLGGAESYYNGFSKTAWAILKRNILSLDGHVCEGQPQQFLEKLKNHEVCDASYIIAPGAGHEMTALPDTFLFLFNK